MIRFDLRHSLRHKALPTAVFHCPYATIDCCHQVRVARDIVRMMSAHFSEYHDDIADRQIPRIASRNFVTGRLTHDVTR
jgi:hypothetical protein